MSEADEELREVGSEEQARRGKRACDKCRSRKIGCDSAKTASGVCTNCAQSKLSCTFVEQARKRGPPKGYLESIERRLERFENIISRLAPGQDFTGELGAPIPEERDAFDLEEHLLHEPPGAIEAAALKKRKGKKVVKKAGLFSSQDPSPSTTANGGGEGSVGTASEDEAEMLLRQQIMKMRLQEGEEDFPKGFTGKSSGYALVDMIQEMKASKIQGTRDDFVDELKRVRREELWKVPDWEAKSVHLPPSDFSVRQKAWPDDDLAETLIQVFFEEVSPFHPVLHRPSFEKRYRAKDFETDHVFCSMCFAVFALASRVFRRFPVVEKRTQSLPNHPVLSLMSTGWGYFSEAMRIPFEQACLEDLASIQVLALLSLFSLGSTQAQKAWVLAGIALRACIDLGLHRFHVVRVLPTMEERELSKRVFWQLYCLDRLSSANLGRPVTIQDDDIDLDMPLAVDDIHWADGFKQPPNVPSQLSYFIASIKLAQIQTLCLRTIYAINKPKSFVRFNTQEAREHVVSEIDSALNQWLATIPQHLLWNPHQPDFVFFRQSATLYSSFYALQIFCHRPFIPKPGKKSKLSFPSYAICTQAARSGATVMDIDFRKTGACPQDLTSHIVTFAIITLYGAIAGSTTNYSVDKASMLREFEKCQNMMAATEKTWIVAGRLLDLFRVFSAGVESSISVETSLKRSREIDEKVDTGKEKDAGASVSRQSSATAKSTRKTAGRPRKSDAKGSPSASIGSNRQSPVHSVGPSTHAPSSSFDFTVGPIASSSRSSIEVPNGAQSPAHPRLSSGSSSVPIMSQEDLAQFQMFQQWMASRETAALPTYPPTQPIPSFAPSSQFPNYSAASQPLAATLSFPPVNPYSNGFGFDQQGQSSDQSPLSPSILALLQNQSPVASGPSFPFSFPSVDGNAAGLGGYDFGMMDDIGINNGGDWAMSMDAPFSSSNTGVPTDWYFNDPSAPSAQGPQRPPNSY